MFSRFEYTLKQTGFVIERFGSAFADWDAFATERLQPKLNGIHNPTFVAARTLLLSDPPKRQIKDKHAGKWHWDPATPQRNGESDAQYLLRLVRNVRNNLFHGGKYPEGPVMDSQLRDRQLLEACLNVIGECCSLDSGFRDVFDETH